MRLANYRGWLALALCAAASAMPIAAIAQTVEYVHTDALGSVVAITDASGAIIERNEYEPFGHDLTGIKDGPGFTGHVSDAATNLSYMQQRYYDPGIGRFLSVDPITASPDTGTNFNRYHYASNNPYKFVDPDGRRACGKDTTCRLAQGDRGGTLRMAGGSGERSAKQAASIAGKATEAANRAIAGIANRRFKTPGVAARAWSDRVRSVADKYDTEIASRLFYDKSSIALGSATSDGFRYEVNPDRLNRPRFRRQPSAA